MCDHIARNHGPAGWAGFGQRRLQTRQILSDRRRIPGRFSPVNLGNLRLQMLVTERFVFASRSPDPSLARRKPLLLLRFVLQTTPACQRRLAFEPLLIYASPSRLHGIVGRLSRAVLLRNGELRRGKRWHLACNHLIAMRLNALPNPKSRGTTTSARAVFSDGLLPSDDCDCLQLRFLVSFGPQTATRSCDPPDPPSANLPGTFAEGKA